VRRRVKETTMKLAFLLMLALCLGQTPEAAAQVFIAPPPPPVSMPEIIWNSHIMRQLGTNAAGQAVFGEQLQRDLEKKSGKTGASKPVDRPSATPSYSSALSYPYSGSHVLAALIAQSQAQAGDKTALKADDLNALVGALWNEYQTAFREENERLKMPLNDVASAMTYCIVMSYMTYNGVRELDANKSVAIYRQASRLFLDNPEFAKFSATDRQTLAEVLVAVGGMPGLTFKTTRDSAQMKKVAESTLVKLFGKDGARVKITENGIEF
jgi:hypothetical protein